MSESGDQSKEPVILVEDVTIAYGDTVILSEVTFSVFPGEVFVILGGSGSGKSSLLKNMISLYRPPKGRILIDGDNIVNADGDSLLGILRKIGVMYQSGALFGSMTLLENLRLAMEEFTDLPEEAMNLIGCMKLNLVGLSGFEHHMPSEISGGMQKRAAIARAMALDPSIIFLDEPSAGLDPVTSADLDQLIVNLSRTLGITFVIVTHELASIFNIADRAIMVDREEKGVIADGRPEDLRDHSPNPRVRRFFNRAPANGKKQQENSVSSDNG